MDFFFASFVSILNAHITKSKIFDRLAVVDSSKVTIKKSTRANLALFTKGTSINCVVSVERAGGRYSQ